MSKLRELSGKAKRLLAVHSELEAELGHLPSVRELAGSYGRTTSATHSMLATLRAHGHDIKTRGSK